MLKKINRLKKRKEFAYIYKKGTRIYSPNLTLVKIDSKLPFCKIGFSVNNKIGKAVIRNKIKRRLREIIKPLIPQIKNCNLILVAKPNITELDFQQLKNETINLLKKGKIINENP